jgi:hypothetical protein
MRWTQTFTVDKDDTMPTGTVTTGAEHCLTRSGADDRFETPLEMCRLPPIRWACHNDRTPVRGSRSRDVVRAKTTRAEEAIRCD